MSDTVIEIKNRSGRLPTTGKYETREELENAVVDLKKRRKMSISSIARCCKVSRTTADYILRIKKISLEQTMS